MISKKIKKTTLGLALGILFSSSVFAQSQDVRIGYVMPLSGPYATIGDTVFKGMSLYIKENGGKLGGRNVQVYTIDNESNVEKAEENALKAIQRDKVDVIIGDVHSGVTAKIAGVAVKNKVIMIDPVAGADTLTGVNCSPYFFRVSYTNSQIAAPVGKLAYDGGAKTAVSITWDYAYGTESINAFRETFEKSGGKVLKEIKMKFPDVDFEPHLKEIEKLKPDMVFAAWAGSGSTKFIIDWSKTAMKDKVPLYSNGYLTEGTIAATYGNAEGIFTTFPYAYGLKSERNQKFERAYKLAYKQTPDTFSVAGYDLAQVYDIGLKAAGGDPKNKEAIIAGMKSAVVDSPAGKFSFSKANNPIRPIYLRKVQGNNNVLVPGEYLPVEDPAIGCKMAGK